MKRILAGEDMGCRPLTGILRDAEIDQRSMTTLANVIMSTPLSLLPPFTPACFILFAVHRRIFGRIFELNRRC